MESAVKLDQTPVAVKLEAESSPAWLLSPTADSLMIGGSSILMFILAWTFVDRSTGTNQVSWTAFYLAMAVNNPHFMASYILLYWDKRREMLSNPRFYWAGVIAPLLVIGFFAVCISQRLSAALGYAVNFMYFLVGWHYVKQIYGTIIVTSVRRGYFFSKGEALALKLNLFPVWFMSYFNGNHSIRELLHYGVGYKTLGFPAWFSTLNYVALGASFLALGAMLFYKWLSDGKLPGITAIISFASIYVWYLPSVYHAHFWYLIPFFHSLQYLLFVGALKKNEFQARSVTETDGSPVSQRLYFARYFFGFVVACVGLAFLTFDYLPHWLDYLVPYDEKVFGPELFMFCFITFINIHHYFIDNVIWRRDNVSLKKYLLS